MKGINQNLIIKEAVKEDAKQIIEYVNKISVESDFLTFGKGEFNLSLEDEENIIETSKNTDNSLFIIAKIDGEIVGALNFNGGKRKRTEHFGEFGVSVLKKQWGNGIGKDLIIYLINWAKDTNIIKKINLKVRIDNNNAIKLYEELGFEKEGIIRRYFYLNDEFFDVIEMGLMI